MRRYCRSPVVASAAPTAGAVQPVEGGAQMEVVAAPAGLADRQVAGAGVEGQEAMLVAQVAAVTATGAAGWLVGWAAWGERQGGSR